MKSCRSILLLFVALAALPGCGGADTSVIGTVTYEGQPVQRGVITFTPTDGGKPEGSKILAGEFAIESLQPGQKQVSIIGVFGGAAEKRAPVTSDDKIRSMVETARESEMIPTNAVGNGQTVSIEAGPQEIAIKLSRPESTK